MIVLVLVIGAGLGWIVRSARIQREAVAAITMDRGSVYYDWEWSPYEWDWSKGSLPERKPWAPTWLVSLVGVDYFGHVTDVSLDSFSLATDAVTMPSRESSPSTAAGSR